MGQFYTKGMCPQCHKATLTIWPALTPGGKQRKTCSNESCQYSER